MSSDTPTSVNDLRLCGVGVGDALRWNRFRGIYFNSDYSDTSGNKEREKEGDRGMRSEGQREIEKKSRSSRTHLLITYKACCEQGSQLRHPLVGLRSELSMFIDVDRAGLNSPQATLDRYPRRDPQAGRNAVDTYRHFYNIHTFLASAAITDFLCGNSNHRVITLVYRVITLLNQGHSLQVKPIALTEK